jgi:hypothetical protein
VVLMPARALLVVASVLAVTSCGRALRSCAAYIAILGPSVLTMTCPPPGFQGTEELPGDTITVREQPIPPPPVTMKPKGKSQ